MLWANSAYQGDLVGTFSFGKAFGLPPKLVEAGVKPSAPIGWDPQFSYMIANDPWATGDAKDYIDFPAYRYQRAGVPFLAALLSRALGFEIVPPLLYHAIQFAIVALGFCALASWLRSLGRSPAWALGWFFSLAVAGVVVQGMGDAVADALFAIVMVSALRGRLLPYVLAASLLPLVRESFVIVTGGIALLTALGWLEWRGPQDGTGYRKGWFRPLAADRWAFVGTAVALTPFALWQLYLLKTFGQTAAQSGTSGFQLFDWPMRRAVVTWVEFLVNRSNLVELVMIPVSTATLLFVVWIILVEKTRQTIWLPIMFHFGLMTVMGRTQYIDVFSFAKAFAHILVVLVLLMDTRYRRLAAACLIFWGASGALYTVHQKAFVLFHEKVESATVRRWQIADLVDRQALERSVPDSSAKQFAAEIRIAAPSVAHESRHDFFSFGLRELAFLKVEVVNRGERAWPGGLIKAGIGHRAKDEIVLGYRLIGEDGERAIGIVSHLGADPIAPGEGRTVDMAVLVPPPGRYRLEIAMRHGQWGWFGDGDKRFASVPLTVK